MPIPVNISLSDHLIYLFVSQLLSQVGHHVPQLCCRNEAIAVPVKDLESLDQLFLGVGILHFSIFETSLPSHQGQKLWEIDSAVTIGVDLVDHVLKFGFGGVLSEGSHDSAELLRKGGCTLVVIEPSPFLSKRAKASLN